MEYDEDGNGQTRYVFIIERFVHQFSSFFVKWYLLGIDRVGVEVIEEQNDFVVQLLDNLDTKIGEIVRIYSYEIFY